MTIFDQSEYLICLFIKWPNPGPFFVYFHSFQSNITIFTGNQWHKCPFRVRRRDLNSQPFDYEAPGHTECFNCLFERVKFKSQRLKIGYKLTSSFVLPWTWALIVKKKKKNLNNFWRGVDDDDDDRSNAAVEVINLFPLWLDPSMTFLCLRQLTTRRR